MCYLFSTLDFPSLVTGKMEPNVPYNRMQPEVEMHQVVAQPTIIMAPPCQEKYNSYDRCANIGLGIMQLVFGLMLILFTVSTDSLYIHCSHFVHLLQKEVRDENKRMSGMKIENQIILQIMACLI